MRVALVGLCFLAFTAQSVFAQATGLPTFFAPTRAYGSTELGLTLSRPGGDATALEGRMGASLNRADLAFRAGFADPGGAGDIGFLAGVEARVPVIGRTQSFPFDGSLILGVGRSFVSGGGQTFVPIGLTLGRRLSLDGAALQLTPYLQPTVLFVDDAIFAFGLGLDVRIRGLPEVRLNWGLADMDGFSLGLFWPS